ncbi:electrogenic sodium bicarbonate cotransporter 1-like isoform X2 [Tigriopus californicus]|uniref:electrogenic sodium bicarbonate cotransporter 1-like isoform X2 n=1 Tax=Tigriopus californicus TaxID=6832 RepID=UPI0027D9D982|nr:electrogenic sodium bicarbonate cotransporter 1-like isoform X2 [Tigriopus californicus]
MASARSESEEKRKLLLEMRLLHHQVSEPSNRISLDRSSASGRPGILRKHRAYTMDMSKSDLSDPIGGARDQDAIEDGSGNAQNPVLPLFVQMNLRFQDKDESWREASRWVKFQEDVEDGGKRWSKPYVPSIQLSALMDLKRSLEEGLVALDVEGRNADHIMDELYLILQDDEDPERRSIFEGHQLEELKMILSQRVKLRMKLNLIGKMSSLSTSRPQSLSTSSGLNLKSASPSRQPSREGLNASPPGSPTTGISRQTSMASPMIHPRSYSTSADDKDKDKDKAKKMRSHNLFIKKVPKGAEACIILVATVPFVTKTISFFAKVANPVILEDFCEISSPTRFLGIILGPPGSDQTITDMGKALGTLMSDQIFPLVCYHSKTAEQVITGINTYTQQVTILAPSAWDPKIRLDPPKNLPSLDDRLKQQQSVVSNSISPPPYTSIKNGSSQVGGQDNADGRDSMSNGNGTGGGGDGGHFQDGILNSLVEGQKLTDGSTENQELIRTGRLFGGLILDIKRKLPWFKSDFTDALHIQTVASVIYIYLATITKAITFGGFLGDITAGQQGVLESFLAHALAGGMFCLLGGQPLTVLGCTGPVLIFEKILVDFCNGQGVDYLTFRLWIGLWSTLFCLAIVALDLSAIVRYFTRFTEESFAALIGIIFIVESLKKLYTMSNYFMVNIGFDPDLITVYDESCHCEPSFQGVFSHEFILNATETHQPAMQSLGELLNQTMDKATTLDSKNIPWQQLTVSQCQALQGTLEGHGCPYVADVFFFSVILFFGTFTVAMFLKKFKLTPYFPNKVRSLLSDYAVIIAILVFVGVDVAFDLETPKLIVPTVFRPTRSDIRGWVVPFTREDDPWYLYLGAAIPALLLTILLFMDQQITSVIVNRSEHKLRKGAGYHLDMLVVGIMIGVCSVFGLPWCVAATVLCLGHVDSLKMETETSAPGELPQFLGVREQRVTGVLVFLLTGLSVKLAPILKFIPMPVLYGVLMYMGIASLRGMQFIDRLGLLFMPPKYQPDYSYLRHVPLNKVHLFTLIQIIGLVLLWVIKSTPASLIFPLMVLALVGLRKLMDYFPRIFSQNDLKWLDNLMPDSGKKKKKRNSQSETDNNMDDCPDGLEERKNSNTFVAKRTQNGDAKTVSIDMDGTRERLLNGKESQI